MFCSLAMLTCHQQPLYSVVTSALLHMVLSMLELSRVSSDLDTDLCVENVFMFVECFRELADLICEFEALAEKFGFHVEWCDLLMANEGLCGSCRFVFVPGPLDPGPGNILPR